MRVFPVDRAGRPQFAQAFGATHHGTDIFAPRGTGVLAVDDGTARSGTDPKGGTVATLTTADGTRYYFAHLDTTEGTFPRAVRAGERIGTVGTTGNAAGKPPHLHFEIHTRDGVTVDPFPELAELQLPTAVAPVPPVPRSSSSSSAGALALLVLAYLMLTEVGR